VIFFGPTIPSFPVIDVVQGTRKLVHLLSPVLVLVKNEWEMFHNMCCETFSFRRTRRRRQMEYRTSESPICHDDKMRCYAYPRRTVRLGCV
jgi:hypothetical protein